MATFGDAILHPAQLVRIGVGAVPLLYGFDFLWFWAAAGVDLVVGEIFGVRRHGGHGVAVEACVVVDAAGRARRGKKNSPTRQEQLALEQLDRCLIDLGVPAPGTSHFPSNGPVRVVTREQWRDFCFRGGVTKSDKPDSASRAFLRHLQNLTAKGIIAEWDNLIWRADRVGQNRTDDFLSGGTQPDGQDTTL